MCQPDETTPEGRRPPKPPPTGRSSSGDSIAEPSVAGLRPARRVRDGVPDRANLQGYQVVKLVAPVRSGNQAEPGPE